MHTLTHAEPPGEPAVMADPDPVAADDDEVRGRLLGDHALERLEQQVDALVLLEVADVHRDRSAARTDPLLDALCGSIVVTHAQHARILDPSDQPLGCMAPRDLLHGLADHE